MDGFTFKVGFGRREITPEVGCWLTGYTPHRQSESLHDPLHIIVCAIEQGEKRVLLAASDTVSLGDNAERVRAAMGEATGTPYENVFACATHTHSGPVPFSGAEYTHANPEWADNIFLPMAAEAAKEAAENLTWAEMGIGTVHSEVAISRRQQLEDGRVILGQEPLALFDPTMTVISFRDPEGKTIGNIVHYGCHNTGSGKNPEITRDWCGVMKDRLEQQSGGITAFFNGCEGDCGPRLANGKTTGNLQLALELGGRAGVDACTAWRGIREWRRDCTLETHTGVIRLPYLSLPSAEELKAQIGALGDPELLKREAKAVYTGLTKRLELVTSGEKLPETDEIPTSLIALGPVCIVPSPFESFAAMTMRISRHSPFPYTLVTSKSNVSGGGYLPTAESIPLGGYEVETGYLKKAHPYRTDAAQHFVNGALALLRELEEKI